MSLRRQLPVHSPLPAAALLAGARAAAAGGGEARRRVREALARTFDTSAVALTDSGTTALALALAEAARRREGPAALPAYSCYDLATAADAAGVEVVLYDLEPTSLAPEPGSLRAALEDGASSLVAAPLYGVPVAMEPLRDAADAAGALLAEDAAQGAGASWRGRPLGAHGDVSVLSFGRGKGVTGGGGGALVAPSDEHAGVVEAAARRLGPGSRGLRELAAAAGQWALGRPAVYGIPASMPFLSLGETVYREPHPPAGMPAACAGMLGRTLGTQPAEAATRREHARRLRRAVGEASDLAAVTPLPEGEPGWLRFPVLATSEAARARLSGDRARSLGVMPGYPKPLARLEGFVGRCRNAGGEFPGAERLAADLFTLPTHGRVGERDLRALATLVRRGAGGRDLQRASDSE